jgi:membrane associated rhomboid family serine protease/Flp pilus assembly protein TadD
MPTCPSCGKQFSGFSIGTSPATECSDCRKAKAQALAAQTPQNIAELPNQAVKAVVRQPVVTLTIVGLNVLVYVAMGLSGASWTDPSITHAIRWGADFGPLTLNGQWWRLFTSTFVHFGIVHIGFNMWCLWDLGRSLEFLMGRKAFIVTYVVSGIAASMVSLAWDPWRVSAGASGAIFGVAGAFVSYLYLKKTPIDRSVVQKKLRSLGIFIAYNLFYGLRSGVDNSAHLGGLVAGLILGTVFPSIIRAAAAAGPDAAGQPAMLVESASSTESNQTRIAAKVAFWSALLLVAGAVRLHAVNIPTALYGKAISQVTAGHIDQGIMALQQAVKLKPTFLLGYALLGELEVEQSRAEGAIPVLEEALTLAPNAYDLQHNLALAYLGAGRPREAAAEISQALNSEKDDTWRGQFILGVAEEKTGNSKTAAENLQKVVQAQPDFCEAQDWLAFAYLEQGRPDAARAAYGTALKSRPNDIVASSGLSLLQSSQKQTQLPPSQLAAIALPYSKLVMKSDVWPLFP